MQNQLFTPAPPKLACRYALIVHVVTFLLVYSPVQTVVRCVSLCHCCSAAVGFTTLCPRVLGSSASSSARRISLVCFVKWRHFPEKGSVWILWPTRAPSNHTLSLLIKLHNLNLACFASGQRSSAPSCSSLSLSELGQDLRKGHSGVLVVQQCKYCLSYRGKAKRTCSLVHVV